MQSLYHPARISELCESSKRYTRAMWRVVLTLRGWWAASWDRCARKAVTWLVFQPFMSAAVNSDLPAAATRQAEVSRQSQLLERCALSFKACTEACRAAPLTEQGCTSVRQSIGSMCISALGGQLYGVC